MTGALAGAVTSCCELIEKIHARDSTLTADTFSEAAVALQQVEGCQHLAFLRSLDGAGALGRKTSGAIR